MDIQNLLMNTHKYLKQRNFAYVAMSGLVISNIILSYKILNSEERWILIPQFDVNNRLEGQGDKYSQTYLEHWAAGATQEVLTVNPSTVDRMVLKFLDISSLSFGQIKPTLEKHAEEIKNNQVSTAFYAKEFETDMDSQKVTVKGTFLSWFGGESKPIVENKSFIVGWMIGPKGVLLINKFEENK